MADPLDEYLFEDWGVRLRVAYLSPAEWTARTGLPVPPVHGGGVSWSTNPNVFFCFIDRAALPTDPRLRQQALRRQVVNASLNLTGFVLGVPTTETWRECSPAWVTLFDAIAETVWGHIERVETDELTQLLGP